MESFRRFTFINEAPMIENVNGKLQCSRMLMATAMIKNQDKKDKNN